VPADVKQARLMQLQSTIDALYRAASAAMVGTRQLVLVTGPAAKDGGELAARTANNRVVNFAGPKSLIGSYADVTIAHAYPHSLRGTLDPSNGFPSDAPSAQNATNQAM
jgi:tRNA-2-methylthio-N6-dimethylallyladenosine synthase